MDTDFMKGNYWYITSWLRGNLDKNSSKNNETRKLVLFFSIPLICYQEYNVLGNVMLPGLN
jgi:hypothetical protein